ncbi:hypothetical protein scyTo_0008615 [Scyliorhinus torazame]|uniref:Uncharacterized protein n=1 Tax=Scyliorhinus torazame TaxID=75743 RepID=A0A401PBS5_SCYTO|nr:hypothetical protein [Scyliorhinus torazame]
MWTRAVAIEERERGEGGEASTCYSYTHTPHTHSAKRHRQQSSISGYPLSPTALIHPAKQAEVGSCRPHLLFYSSVFKTRLIWLLFSGVTDSIGTNP